MSDDARKRMGACTVCDREVFACDSRWKVGPLKGDIRSVGVPEPDTRKVTVVRASGHTTTWTVCGKCQVTPDLFPALHRKEMNALAAERACYDDHSDPLMDICYPFEADQHANRERTYKLFAFDIPIGVLCESLWMDSTRGS